MRSHRRNKRSDGTAPPHGWGLLLGPLVVDGCLGLSYFDWEQWEQFLGFNIPEAGVRGATVFARGKYVAAASSE